MGMVAVTRAEPDETKNTVDDIPDGAVKCTMCKGTGEDANHGDCRVCKGKGWMKSAKAMAHRADASTWSEKPWSSFSQSDYTPEQWRDACLIVEGDGTRKAELQAARQGARWDVQPPRHRRRRRPPESG